MSEPILGDKVAHFVVSFFLTRIDPLLAVVVVSARNSSTRSVMGLRNWEICLPTAWTSLQLCSVDTGHYPKFILS